MDRLVQQLNLTAKTRDQKITEYGGYSTEPHRRISHKILNFLDIRLNEENICLFLWLFNDAFSTVNVQILCLRIVADWTRIRYHMEG